MLQLCKPAEPLSCLPVKLSQVKSLSALYVSSECAIKAPWCRARFQDCTAILSRQTQDGCPFQVIRETLPSW